jgi:hypothetical protein
MHKLVSIAAAALLGFAVYGGAVAPSLANPHDDAAGAAVVGGMLGFVAGAAMSDGHHSHFQDDQDDNDDGGDFGPPPPHWHHFGNGYGYGPDGGWHAHVRACFQAYGRNYDPRSDTYIGRSGYPHHCRL